MGEGGGGGDVPAAARVGGFRVDDEEAVGVGEARVGRAGEVGLGGAGALGGGLEGREGGGGGREGFT